MKARLSGIRSRAKREGIPFDLTEEYLQALWTGKCAISGTTIDFNFSKCKSQTASLDRLTPSLGYVEGNVAWVSQKFNKLKSDGSVEDFELILKYMKENYVNR